MSKIGRFISIILNMSVLWTPIIAIVAYWFNDAYGHQGGDVFQLVGPRISTGFCVLFCLNIYWYLRYYNYFERKVRCLLFVVCNAVLTYLSVFYLFHEPGFGDIALFPLLIVVMLISAYFDCCYVIKEPIVQMHSIVMKEPIVQTNDFTHKGNIIEKEIIQKNELPIKYVFYTIFIEIGFGVSGVSIGIMFSMSSFLFCVFLASMFVIPLLITLRSKTKAWKVIGIVIFLLHLKAIVGLFFTS